MSLNKPQIKERLREAGLRATAPRVALYRLMSQSARPMTHSEVVEALGQEDWDQATLYRNLIKFEQEGIIRVASQVGGLTRYELQTEVTEAHLHPHFVCQDCGQVECLPQMRMGSPADARWHAAVAEASIEIVGKCPSCRT